MWMADKPLVQVLEIGEGGAVSLTLRRNSILPHLTPNYNLQTSCISTFV
jgi:hypothetical protein